MAEARSAVSYRVPQSTLTFMVTEEEFVLRINKNAFPSFIVSMQRMMRHSMHRIKNRVVNVFYPAPPYEWVAMVAAPAAVMSSQHALLQPVHDFLWGLLDHFPRWLRSDNSNGQIGVVSVATGLVLVLVNSFARRVVLRALLGYQGWLYDNPKERNLKTVVWGVAVGVVSGRYSIMSLFGLRGSNSGLYSHQHSLPGMPVPYLADTCSHFLQSVEPVLDPVEYDRIKGLCDKFMQNEGPKLNRYLTLKSWFTPNYVTDWWDKYIYLRGRSPIVINSNYYILDSRTPKAPTPHVAARAANICYEFLHLKREVDRETFPPMVIHGTVPMCMWQYERIFSLTRVPGKEMDSLQTYDESQHIAVMCRGHWYIVDVYHANGSCLSPVELESQFKWILHHSERAPPASEAETLLAALTTENRTVWANAREEFFAHGINKFSLNEIESAIFVVSLQPDTKFEECDWNSMAKACFHGNGHNLWVDKSFNAIFFGDGKVGFHCEHSWADAPVMSHALEMTLILGEYMGKGYDAEGWNIRGPKDSLKARKPPALLRWDFSIQATKVIKTAQDHVQALIDDIDLYLLHYHTYGKGFIKRCKMSPDGYVQMALQLAYYRNAGKFALTYESAMTRLFLHGRTETVRPVSLASVAFVKSFDDPHTTNERKIALMHDAVSVHQQGYRGAMTGKGIDRHLFALYVMSMGLGMNSEFLAAALSMPWRLSTSQQPQSQSGKFDPVRNKDDAKRISPGGGFGPVADDGYGVSYMVATDDEFFFHISSKNSCKTTSSRKLADDIVRALDDIHTLFSKTEQK